jgi:hypothetical protein
MEGTNWIRLRSQLSAFLGVIMVTVTGWSEDSPLTRNVPIPESQNRQADVKPYNFDAPPEGLFRAMEVAEGFEEELGFRREHEIVPVNPTSEFLSNAKPVFTVFQLDQPFQGVHNLRCLLSRGRSRP